MWTRVGIVLSLMLCGAVLAGCGKPLFPRNAARSPYERYMALRGERAEAVEYDAFGREQPALRQRLKPMSQP